MVCALAERPTRPIRLIKPATRAICRDCLTEVIESLLFDESVGLQLPREGNRRDERMKTFSWVACLPGSRFVAFSVPGVWPDALKATANLKSRKPYLQTAFERASGERA